MKTLVIYYSRKGENYVNGSIKNIDKGNTEIAAEYIRDAVRADLFEIETVKEYDKSYMTCIEEAKAELRENARPELKKKLDSVGEYDNIVVAERTSGGAKGLITDDLTATRLAGIYIHSCSFTILPAILRIFSMCALFLWLMWSLIVFYSYFSITKWTLQLLQSG